MRKTYFRSLLILIVNALLILAFATITRLIFCFENAAFFNDLSTSHLLKLFFYGIKFDISGLAYVNILYIILMVFPCHIKETDFYQKICKWIYVIGNSLFLAINLCDTVYFRFVGKRTTFSVFSEFSHDHNLVKIGLEESLSHWYLVLAGLLLIYLLYRLYFMPARKDIRPLWKYYLVQVPCAAIIIYLTVIGMRGGIGIDVRPLSNADANRFVNNPVEASIVLNTPFSMIRTYGKSAYKVPVYYQGDTKKELDALYSPVHYPKDTCSFTPKNVVIIVMESIGKEYSGMLNKDLDGGTYKGYTPFLDSLRQESMYYEYTFAHGRQSIDALPSILSSIPKVHDPFMLTPYGMNSYNTIPGLLKKKGYHTSFFFGSPNGSMGFEGFNRAGGVDHIFQKDEYPDQSKFDGWWGIWDEPYMQYFVQNISDFQQPFATTLYTISSHHPYHVPEQYEGVFPEGPLAIHKCAGYTDNALRQLFKTASRQDWYDNTIFVLCADHTNQTCHDIYMNSVGSHEIQMMFYSPSGDLKGQREGIAQQIDIMPTLLNYLHYDEPYIAFGCDLLNTPAEQTWAMNWYNGFFQYFKNDYVIFWDGSSDHITSMYDFIHDPLLTENLSGKGLEQENRMFMELKSIDAQYMDRMLHDELVLR